MANGDLDRITKILTDRRPTLRDISSALNTAVANQTSYGEAYSALRARKIAEGQAILDAFNKEREFALRERQAGLAEKRHKLATRKVDLDTAKFLAEQGNRDADALVSAIDRFVPNPAERAVVFNEIQDRVATNQIDDPDVANANRVVARVVGDMAKARKITGRQYEKPTAPKEFVSWFNPSTGERKAARKGSKQAEALAAQGFIPGDPAKETSPFGAGLEGRAYEALMEYNTYVRAGQTPPQDVVDRATIAGHSLTQKRFLRSPEGDLLSYTPGIPPGFQVPGQEPISPPAAEPETAEAPAPSSGLQIEMVKPEEAQSTPESARRVMGEIAGLLNESQAAGETITGLAGWLKAEGGGFARQLGIPVSPKAKNLARKLATLQAIMTPIVLGEKGKSISDKDRQRIEKIIGNLDPSQDDVDIRQALLDLLPFVEALEADQ